MAENQAHRRRESRRRCSPKSFDGAHQCSLRRPSGQQHAIRRREVPDKPKDPYSGISLKDAKDIYGDERRSSPTHGALPPVGRNKQSVEGAQNESAHLAVLNQIMKKVAGESPQPRSTRIPATGFTASTSSRPPRRARRARSSRCAGIKTRSLGLSQQNGGTITKKQQDSVPCGPPELAERLSARVGQDAYAGLSMAALNGGPVAERITALRNSSPAARAAYNAIHNIQVLSKMPANEQKARPTGTDKDRNSRRRNSSGERGWRQAAI